MHIHSFPQRLLLLLEPYCLLIDDDDALSFFQALSHTLTLRVEAPLFVTSLMQYVRVVAFIPEKG